MLCAGSRIPTTFWELLIHTWPELSTYLSAEGVNLKNKKGATPYEITPLNHIKDTTRQTVEQLETAIQILINATLTWVALLVVMVGSAVTL